MDAICSGVTRGSTRLSLRSARRAARTGSIPISSARFAVSLDRDRDGLRHQMIERLTAFVRSRRLLLVDDRSHLPTVRFARLQSGLHRRGRRAERGDVLLVLALLALIQPIADLGARLDRRAVRVLCRRVERDRGPARLLRLYDTARTDQHE